MIAATAASTSTVADENLSLMELGLFARDEHDEYLKWRGRAKKSAYKATAAIFRMGRWLSQAHTRLLDAGRGEWTAFLSENEIPRTTAHEAEGLFHAAKTEVAVGGMTPTQAKRHFGVVRPKQNTTSPTVDSVKADRTVAEDEFDDGVSAPLPIRRYSEPPFDPDGDSGQPIVSTPRPKPTKRQSNSTDRVDDAVEQDAAVPQGAAERDVEPAATPGDELPLPGEQHPLYTAIVQIVRRLELIAEDLPTQDLTAEPTDAVRREVARAIELLSAIHGGIAQ